MRRYRWANTPPEKRKFLRKSQLWSQDFTSKLFCNVEFWIDRLPRLIALGLSPRLSKFQDGSSWHSEYPNSNAKNKSDEKARRRGLL
jgi:hypothetical protein